MWYHQSQGNIIQKHNNKLIEILFMKQVPTSNGVLIIFDLLN
jgi:hypothetical protein